MRSLQDRFSEKYEIVPESGCWLWTAVVTRKGYGKIKEFKDGAWRDSRAHRVSYELHNGPIPDGLHVLHSCDIPFCVNPSHLFLGTNEENVADKMAKGRHICGERVGNSKLTEADVINIRAIYEHIPSATLAKLASIYGVSQSQVSNVVNHKQWRG